MPNPSDVEDFLQELMAQCYEEVDTLRREAALKNQRADAIEFVFKELADSLHRLHADMSA